MLTAQTVMPELVGAFYGTAAVENLQKALTSLAQAANWPVANPGPITGDVNVQTISAVAGTVASIPGIPSAVKTGLLAAAVGAAFNAQMRAEATKLIEQYATQLTAGVAALISKYSGAKVPAPGSIPVLQTINPILVRATSASAGLYTTDPTTGALVPATKSFAWNPPPGTPWYKHMKVWAAIGGIAAAGGVAYFAMR